MMMDGNGQSFFSFELQIVIVVCGALSSIVSLIIPVLYYSRKQCREHPMGIVVNISLIEAITNYNVVLIAISIYKFQSLVNVKGLFQFLTFNPPSEPTDIDFCEINFLVYVFLEILSISFHICFSLDLFITLKFPFFPGRKRTTYYNLFSLAICIVGIPLSLKQSETICQNQFFSRSIYKIPLAFTIIVFSYMFLSIIIIVYSFYKQRQVGQFRANYIKYHRMILILLIFIWIFPTISNILILRGDQESIVFSILNIISFFSLLLSGLLLTILRLYIDNFLWIKVKSMLRHPFSQEKEEKEKYQQRQGDNPINDAWNMPLANAVAHFQNQKMVHNIVQVVLETCLDNSLQHLNLKSGGFEEFEQLREALLSGKIEEIKRAAKVNKFLMMECDTKKINQTEDNYQQKNIFVSMGSKIVGIKIQVQSIADELFSDIRQLNKLDNQQLNQSLGLMMNSNNIKKARQSLGASGSFFFFSYDYKLVIKTIPYNEVNTLQKFLPYYYIHLKKNPKSLFSKIYGLFSVYIEGVSKFTFIMMENSFYQMQSHKFTYRIYDLKGSTIKRQVKNPKQNTVLKDINYLKSSDAFIFLTHEKKEELVEQIKQDVTLLSNHNIMDYSLLLGVSTPHQMVMMNNQSKWSMFTDMDERRVYSLSIIDYLQQFNFSKYMELQLKKIFKGGGDISSVDSETYYKRFMTFVKRIIVVIKKKKIEFN